MLGCAIHACRKRHRVVDERFLRATALCFSSLETPTVLFQDNHLLAVNKPVGWHSVPNPGPVSPKCLLSELKRMEVGGGRHKDYLLSLHRIDQPCSGVILFAKTSKAASRVTALWKKKMVQKQYICVVSGDRIETLLKRSVDTSSDDWYSMAGQLSPNMKKNHRSVLIRPVDDSQTTESTGRKVSLEWKLFGVNNDRIPKFQTILVKTNDGSRHMVRAMLAQVGGCPIQGDVRYNAATVPLNDQSVALHAFRLSLNPSLKLGSLNVFDFEAPIPKTWANFFGI
jgi:23S rRNA pseudouridine1911/1915/1917 synthase